MTSDHQTRLERIREQARLRQRRHREREKHGIDLVTLPIGRALLEDTLIRIGLLSPRDADNDMLVALAVCAGVRLLASADPPTEQEVEMSRVTVREQILLYGHEMNPKKVDDR